MESGPGWKRAADKLRDNSRRRNASSAAFTTPTKMQAGLKIPSWNRNHLRHHGDQNWPPCGEHDIADRVGHGVAQSRQVAISLFLDRAKRSGDRPCSATSTQYNHGVHLQHITTEQDRYSMRENRDHKADEDQADSRLLKPRK